MPPYPITLALFLFAIPCAAFALYAWRHRTVDGARLVTAILVGSTVSMLGYGLELIAPDLPTKMLFVQIRYLGISIVAPAFVLAALWYAGYDQWLAPRRIALIALLPVVSEIGFLTNDWHHLHYVTVGLSHSSDFPELAKTNGPLYWFYITHSLAYTFIAVGVMLQTFLAAPRAQRNQTGLVLFGTATPMIATLVYLAGIRPYGFFNFLLPAFAITALLYGWAIFRHRLLDLRPIANRLVLDRNPMGVIVIDQNRRVADINHAAREMLNLQSRDALGKSVSQVAGEWRELDAYLARDTTATQDVPYERAGVRRVFAIETASLGAEGHVMMVRDVTERRAAEQTALAQQRVIAAVEERERMARELHDGIAQVMGYVNLETGNALEALARNQIEPAQATLTHMREVAADAHADLRDFILGVRSGETPIKGFFPTLEHYAEQFNANYGLPVTLSKPDEWNDATLDPTVEAQLLRVIQEALTNARKHAQATAVTVTFTLTDHTAQVIIADNGCGFTPLPVERRKNQAHFGLQIMRERIAEIGGTFDLRSVAGQGTQIIVQVPRAATPADHASGLRVLLVDDQPLFRDGLRNLLSARGVHIVGIADNGRQAVEQTRLVQPDLVLMDLQMPEMDGLTALKLIKAEFPAIRVVLLTVSQDTESLREALNAHANGYLLKNINPREFYDMLERIMRGETLVAPDLAARAMSDETLARDAELTARQKRILALIAQGKTNKEIATEFILTEAAIKYHVRQILERLDVSTRDQAVEIARQRGWVESSR